MYARTSPCQAADMRAIVYDHPGDSDVLELRDRPVPEPGPGEVRVRIAVSGVNPTDWKGRRTPYPGTPEDAELVPNQDGAGTVDAVGEGVDPGLAGRRVWLWEAAFQRGGGTAQEYAVVAADHVVPLPDGVSFDVGASLGVPAITAHRCLTVAEGGPERLARGALDGRTVLVAGGAGAVGNAAIQLARWAGATVLTTVSSPEKAALARAAGAHHVINYRDEDAAEAVRRVAADGVDVVVEVAPAANARLDSEVVAVDGVVASYANNGGDEVTLPIRDNMYRNARWQFVLIYTMPQAAREHAVEGVTAALADGAFRVGEGAGLPLYRYPLEETAAAHDAVENGAVGKVLVDVSPA
jgi:NADPH2:quinone reductase